MTQIGFEELSPEVRQHFLRMSAEMMVLEHAFICMAKHVSAGVEDQAIINFTNDVRESVLAATAAFRQGSTNAEVAVDNALENLTQAVLAVTGVSTRQFSRQ